MIASNGSEFALPVITFGRSRMMFLVMLSILAFSLLGLIVSVFLLAAFSPFLFAGGWQSAFAALPALGVVISGKGLFDLCKRLKSRKQPMLLLDEFGVHVWEPHEEVFPWHALTSVKIERISKAEFLMLGVIERDNYLSLENRWFNGQLGINLLPLKGSPKHIAQAIRSYPLYAGEDRMKI